MKRMFGGSSEALLMAMVDTRQISAEELARVAKNAKTGGGVQPTIGALAQPIGKSWLGFLLEAMPKVLAQLALQ